MPAAGPTGCGPTAARADQFADDLQDAARRHLLKSLAQRAGQPCQEQGCAVRVVVDRPLRQSAFAGQVAAESLRQLVRVSASEPEHAMVSSFVWMFLTIQTKDSGHYHRR